MNDDLRLLSMLLRYSQRRMVVSLGLLQAHFVGDAVAARAVISRLSRLGLLYVEGPAVRLTLAGFAVASSHAPAPASVHPVHPAAKQQAVGRSAAA